MIVLDKKEGLVSSHADSPGVGNLPSGKQFDKRTLAAEISSEGGLSSHTTHGLSETKGAQKLMSVREADRSPEGRIRAASKVLASPSLEEKIITDTIDEIAKIDHPSVQKLLLDTILSSAHSESVRQVAFHGLQNHSADFGGREFLKELFEWARRDPKIPEPILRTMLEGFAESHLKGSKEFLIEVARDNSKDELTRVEALHGLKSMKAKTEFENLLREIARVESPHASLKDLVRSEGPALKIPEGIEALLHVLNDPEFVKLPGYKMVSYLHDARTIHAPNLSLLCERVVNAPSVSSSAFKKAGEILLEIDKKEGLEAIKNAADFYVERLDRKGVPLSSPSIERLCNFSEILRAYKDDSLEPVMMKYLREGRIERSEDRDRLMRALLGSENPEFSSAAIVHIRSAIRSTESDHVKEANLLALKYNAPAEFGAAAEDLRRANRLTGSERIQLMRELIELNLPESLPFIRDVLTQTEKKSLTIFSATETGYSPEDKGRLIAMNALSELTHPGTEALVDQLHRSSNERYRQLGATIKAYRGDSSVLTELVRYSKNSDEEVRIPSISALCMMKSPDAARAVFRALRSGSESERNSTSAAAGKTLDSPELRERFAANLEAAKVNAKDKNEQKLIGDYCVALRECQALNIEHPFRFSAQSLIEIVKNRSHQEVDTRPLAMVVLTKSDENNAFYSISRSVDKLTERGFRVVMHEVDSDKAEKPGDPPGFVDVLRRECGLEDPRHGKPAALLLVGGHGTYDQISLGDGDPASHKVDPGKAVLDLNDRALLKNENISAALAEKGQIILISCSTGNGLEKVPNMANLFREVFPQALPRGIVAPTQPVRIESIKFKKGAPVEIWGKKDYHAHNANKEPTTTLG